MTLADDVTVTKRILIGYDGMRTGGGVLRDRNVASCESEFTPAHVFFCLVTNQNDGKAQAIAVMRSRPCVIIQ